MTVYSKALVALGALATTIGTALIDGAVSPQEYGQIGIAAAAAVGVWLVRNKPAAA